MWVSRKVNLYPSDILFLSPLLLYLGDFNGYTKKSVVSLRRGTGQLKDDLPCEEAKSPRGPIDF